MKQNKGTKELHGFTLDVELIIISVVQGVALTFLIDSSRDLIGHMQMEYWPYIFTAFLFILLFWTQAIIHALSFIEWPLDLGHNYLYFLSSFAEVFAFTQIGNPLGWFILVAIFFICGEILYLYDLKLIKNAKKEFQTSQARKELYDDILKRHVHELKILVPAGLAYNLLAIWLIVTFPEVMLTNHNHVWLAIIQFCFCIFLLIHTVKTFAERRALITKARNQE